MIDFTNLPVRNKTYAGANGSKISVLYNNELYMLKFPAVPAINYENDTFVFHRVSLLTNIEFICSTALFFVYSDSIFDRFSELFCSSINKASKALALIKKLRQKA